jgi:hypothetical protein
MVGNVLALLVVAAQWHLLADHPVRCIELLNLTAPRAELDSEWLWFVNAIREKLSGLHPNLTMR